MIVMQQQRVTRSVTRRMTRSMGERADNQVCVCVCIYALRLSIVDPLQPRVGAFCLRSCWQRFKQPAHLTAGVSMFHRLGCHDCQALSQYNWCAKLGTKQQVTGALISEVTPRIDCYRQESTGSMQSAGRGITRLHLIPPVNAVGLASPSMILQNFTFLITLRLNVPHVRWSDLRNINELVHLESLHLCEDQGYWNCPGDWAFRRSHMTNRSSPFVYLSKLKSLHLELFGLFSADKHWDLAPWLQPISCMTKLGALTLLMQGSYCTWDIQHLSQLSHLTSLGIHSLEQGVSILMNLQQLSVKATEPPAQHHVDTNLPNVDLAPSLAVLTSLKSLNCGDVLWQQVPVLTALTALTFLILTVKEGAQHHARELFWSSLSTLPSLISLEVNAAYLEANDFHTVATMTKLTKLHFCGYTDDLQISARDLTRFSALASLQHLHLEFEADGRWSKRVQKLDKGLKRLHDIRSMHHFQVIFNRSNRERVMDLKPFCLDLCVESSDSEHEVALQWEADDSLGVDSNSYLSTGVFFLI